ncbi:TetR/AcrR family transcriptional regulator [Qipengyuania qiaonensis]|uniref:TetR/AcrR family transcriptional regulator n=1 Tax=Qipengyuania qiaonensis TaxID=2867240 RepID=A0ABS7J6H7_9SPHN|nr:TetR/AcrR family transcriptional regulator [Qipengyuania qiaonensis]MBX7482932.1 TetR/AcrR family transcriptional regulator [Qipengyuania qiaonensis]
MARQSRSEIDEEIIDCAAGLFAHQGFGRTSLQQIADALGYSKAGLLHYYPSKKALYEAVVDTHVSRTRQRTAMLLDFPLGIERDRAMIGAVLEEALRFPGMAEFGHYMAREPADDRIGASGIELIQALGVNVAAPDMDRMARAFTAMAGANFAIRIAGRVGLDEAWRDEIFAAAMRALGYTSFSD